jgi:hypothetical protein
MLPSLKMLKFKSGSCCPRFSLWLFAMMTILSGASALAEAAFQYHCAGGSELAADSHLTFIHKALALPSTTNMEDFALDRFASLLTNSLRLGNNPSAPALIGSLLGDVARNESLGSFSGATKDGPSFILAVHLDAQRAQLWQDNFGKIFGGHGEAFKSQEFTGWRWNTSGSNSFWIIPAQDWLLVGCGNEFLSLQVEYLKQIKTQGRPAPALDHTWLEADIASARLGGWFRYLKPANIKLTITPKEDDLHITASVLEGEAAHWQAGPWQIPRELMRGQIISFTAGQNVAAFLNLNPALSRLPGNPLTNQFYFWALDQVPMLNFMAWPEAHASNALASLAATAPTALNPELKRFNGTELAWYPEAGKLVCQNMQLFNPALEAVQINDGQFLFLSSFARLLKTKGAPDALLEQIKGRTHLIYYDWELTGRRLQEWQFLSQMIANRSMAPEKDVIYKAGVESEWLRGLSPLAGNTVTEITVVAPNELSLTRKAPLGFTAVELMLLSDWICEANAGPIHSPPPFGKKAPSLVRP